MPEYIRQTIKDKRSLRRLFIQRKGQNIKPSFLTSVKKGIKKDITDYRDKQWETKLKKIKISSDWQNIKSILGMSKEKMDYPELKFEDKKATTNKKQLH